MRKLMLLAAMLAMVLAVAAPAMAQDNTGGDQTATGCEAVQDVIQRVQQDATAGAGGAGGDAGDATAAALQVPIAVDVVPILSPGDTEATAAQYAVSIGGAGGAGGDAVNVVTLTPTQYQDCESVIGQYQAVGDVAETTTPATTTTTTTGTTTTGGTTGGTTTRAATAGGALPATGGFSLLALGTGALLVGGGLLARRIVR